MAERVLVVEDDPNTLEIVELYLRRDGYEVLVAKDGMEGLALSEEQSPDLVILDLMLPKLHGMDLCQRLRQVKNVPIIMLTAMVEEKDRLAGLEIGADDYVTKPFSPRELAARVKAVLRRTARDANASEEGELARGGVTLDLRRHLVHAHGEQIDLTPTEFRLLAMLMQETGRTFSRAQIIDQVLGYDFDGFDRTVDAHVSNLRRKLKAGPDGEDIIRTVYGVGYRFGVGD
ncbi:MAG: response regulator transcription factor [Dehalococcoidia bacterium]|nr:response regulator transcription factor [Dehalococcoidia bacterium]